MARKIAACGPLSIKAHAHVRAPGRDDPWKPTRCRSWTRPTARAIPDGGLSRRRRRAEAEGRPPRYRENRTHRDHEGTGEGFCFADFALNVVVFLAVTAAGAPRACRRAIRIASVGAAFSRSVYSGSSVSPPDGDGDGATPRARDDPSGTSATPIRFFSGSILRISKAPVVPGATDADQSCDRPVGANVEACASPSMPGSSSTNAPNSAMRVTRPGRT